MTTHELATPGGGSVEDARALSAVLAPAGIAGAAPALERVDVIAGSESRDWRPQYQRFVVAIDLVAGVLGVVTGFAVRSGLGAVELTAQQFVLAAALPLIWITCAGLNRSYEARFLGAGTIEFERIGRAFLHLVALTAFIAFAIRADLSRGFVMVALAGILIFSVVGRYAARKALHRRRANSNAMISVLAVGRADEICRFDDALRRNHHAGLTVAAACVTGPDGAGDADTAELVVRGIDSLGDVDSIREAVTQSGARSVAVVSRDISGETLRWISWQLEGTGTDLVLLPALTEVAGRRLNMQQVGGLPLLYVAEPEFRGSRRLIKSVVDRFAAAIALLVLAPALLIIAALVRLTSRGPAFFLQTRVGKNGTTFRMIKFRSMCSDAEKLIVELKESNEVVGGTLFKIRADPRVTRVGRVLRRYSLDELPQLFNILGGSMSLVGPRPPLVDEVALYRDHTHRRLLVKPGLTGLWQISGRSELSWEESVRLDLRYVESWSLTLDLVVLLKTVAAVIRQTGAY